MMTVSRIDNDDDDSISFISFVTFVLITFFIHSSCSAISIRVISATSFLSSISFLFFSGNFMFFFSFFFLLLLLCVGFKCSAHNWN
ncbi:uncharacterized protein DS421_4g118720 [Arachis hypogaea]|nr:uncharacterized protein DS421_4g118720 [Arachis hypogaea]